MSIRTLIKVVMALGCMKLLLAGGYLYFQAAPDPSTPSAAVAASRSDSGSASTTVADSSGCRPELLNVVKARARELERRKTELDARERELQLLKGEIETMLKELQRLQQQLGSPIKKAQKDSELRFQHLVGVYSSMEPGRAAALLGKMDEDTVTRIFASMKSKKVAAIMALMDPDAAASISAKLTRMGR